MWWARKRVREKNRLCQGMILEQSGRHLGRGNIQSGILTREEDSTHGRKQGSVDWGETGRAFGKGATRKALGNRAGACRTLSILDFYPRSCESPSRALRRGVSGSDSSWKNPSGCCAHLLWRSDRYKVGGWGGEKARWRELPVMGGVVSLHF